MRNYISFISKNFKFLTPIQVLTTRLYSTVILIYLFILKNITQYYNLKLLCISTYI